MIIHTGARVLLKEWGGTVRCDIYNTPGLQGLALNVDGSMVYEDSNKAEPHDYEVSHIHEWLNRNRSPSVIIVDRAKTTALSDKAKEMLR